MKVKPATRNFDYHPVQGSQPKLKLTSNDFSSKSKVRCMADPYPLIGAVGQRQPKANVVSKVFQITGVRRQP